MLLLASKRESQDFVLQLGPFSIYGFSHKDVTFLAKSGLTDFKDFSDSATIFTGRLRRVGPQTHKWEKTSYH